MGRNSGSKKPVLSMDFKSVEAPDNVSIPGQSNDTGYQISETVVTKTKVTHSTKNSKTIKVCVLSNLENITNPLGSRGESSAPNPNAKPEYSHIFGMHYSLVLWLGTHDLCYGFFWDWIRVRDHNGL